MKHAVKIIFYLWAPICKGSVDQQCVVDKTDLVFIGHNLFSQIYMTRPEGQMLDARKQSSAHSWVEDVTGQ